MLYFQQKYWRTCVSSLASDVFRSARSSKLNFFVIKSVDKDESNMQFINALIAKKRVLTQFWEKFENMRKGVEICMAYTKFY